MAWGWEEAKGPNTFSCAAPGREKVLALQKPVRNLQKKEDSEY